MEELKERLKELFNEYFPGSDVIFEETDPSEKIFGYLIWKGFDESDMLDRQRAVWNRIRSSFDREDQRCIAAVFTVTPDELAVMKEG